MPGYPGNARKVREKKFVFNFRSLLKKKKKKKKKEEKEEKKSKRKTKKNKAKISI